MAPDKTGRSGVQEARQHLSTETHDNRPKRKLVSIASWAFVLPTNPAGYMLARSEAKVVDPPHQRPQHATPSQDIARGPWG